MEVALLVGAVVVSGLACPAMMWWNRRNGREACCLPGRDGQPTASTEDLYRRRDELALAIAAETARPARSRAPGTPTA